MLPPILLLMTLLLQQLTSPLAVELALPLVLLLVLVMVVRVEVQLEEEEAAVVQLVALAVTGVEGANW